MLSKCNIRLLATDCAEHCQGEYDIYEMISCEVKKFIRASS